MSKAKSFQESSFLKAHIHRYTYINSIKLIKSWKEILMFWKKLNGSLSSKWGRKITSIIWFMGTLNIWPSSNSILGKKKKRSKSFLWKKSSFSCSSICMWLDVPTYLLLSPQGPLKSEKTQEKSSVNVHWWSRKIRWQPRLIFLAQKATVVFLHVSMTRNTECPQCKCSSKFKKVRNWKLIPFSSQKHSENPIDKKFGGFFRFLVVKYLSQAPHILQI